VDKLSVAGVAVAVGVAVASRAHDLAQYEAALAAVVATVPWTPVAHI
jgi:hypothetical protein